MNFHRFRPARGVTVLSQASYGDGIKSHTWSTTGLPVRLFVSFIRSASCAPLS
ncbi:hypothetical protein [Streptomyces sp. PBH53]|uniref:hypothetical protein n=1 Tax=Streptomyces sp. PBH53 TaxID=1577075 RepID=UPI001AD84AAD|nr:hypothetical protein [Streptomyces sp. PBH53]